jgi:septal ring factor EnvC (AmiA/AmiB activator)
VSTSLFFLVLLFVGDLRAAVSPVPAEAVSVTRDLRDKRADLKDVQRRLEREKKMRQAAERRERNVLNRLDSSDRQIERLSREEKANEGDLGKTVRNIGLLEIEKERTATELAERRLSLGRRLKALQHARGSDSVFSAALGLHRAGDDSRRIRFGVLLARSNQNLVEQVEQKRRLLTGTSERLVGEKARRERILSALERQKNRVTNEKTGRERLLSSIRSEKVVREAAIADLSLAATNLSQKVGELLRQQMEAEKRLEEQRRVEAERRQREASGRAVAQPSQAREKPVTEKEGRLASPMVGGAGLKRGLPWPVAGLVTQRFGKTKSREFNTTLESAGLQIRAARGTPVKAVASGRVRYADWFQGYGKLVILDHGRGYYSLYAQTSDLFVAPGDIVKAGQPIASVGDTGSLVGNSLYFEVRKDGLPQNPMAYLRPKS